MVQAGEKCEDRGKAYAPTCANRCPRTCADLWDHVECLQGPCKPGCRCPEGQLLQDGVCVPVAECLCGLPSTNVTLELWPGQAAELDCHNCTCENGTFACPAPECPSYGPWAGWSPCSQSCGGGRALRHRPCHESPHGAPCSAQAMEEVTVCNPQPCAASCQVSTWSAWSPCSASCGGGISEQSRHLLDPGESGSQDCPGLLLRLHRPCNTHGCAPGPTPPSPWFSNLSREELEKEHAPGSIVHHQCNSCVCRGGAFVCSQQDCNGETRSLSFPVLSHVSRGQPRQVPFPRLSFPTSPGP
ncbi:hypothetical protein Y1Q_0007660 [Alligator mississippiensis]|uniref:TIL domain-containing protein n=1 Tax=Alligator mississippiensis TaxID=8496 RepID=A0A151N7D7_ALLMI|nr:hypothetical protein Y1Q_0007660 [Alligator mississippiensis]